MLHTVFKRRTTSYLITSENIDQSKTMMLKGD
jgi:hypothetical protein